jgi:hypothetical protein
MIWQIHQEDHRMDIAAIASVSIDLGKTSFHLVVSIATPNRTISRLHSGGGSYNIDSYSKGAKRASGAASTRTISAPDKP